MATATALALFLAASAATLPQQLQPPLIPAALAQDVKNPSPSIETAELHAADFGALAREPYFEIFGDDDFEG